MNYFEKRHYEKILLKVDESDMSLTTEEILNMKDDIHYITYELNNKAESMLWWITIPTSVLCLGGGIASGAGSTAAGLIMLGAGVTYGLVGYCTMWFYYSRANKLDNKSRLLIVDAVPVIDHDNLTLNISVFRDNINNKKYIGPGISVSF